MPITAPSEEKEQEWSQEEIDKTAAAINDSLFGPSPKTEEKKDSGSGTDKPKEKTSPDEEAAKKKAEEEKAAADAAAKKKTEDEAKKPTPAPPAPTADEIADRVAEKMTPKKEEAPKIDLSDEDKKNREIIAFMEQEDPSNAGLVKKFDAFVTSEKAYRDTWEKANPGQKFDPEDSSHEEFYSANDPIWGKEDDFDEAKIELKLIKKHESREAKKAQEQTYAEAVKSAKEKLQNHRTEIVSDLLKETDPELAKIDVAKLADTDPAADIVIQRHVPTLEAMTAELVKAFTPGLNYLIDASKSPLHEAIVRATFEYENEQLALPADKRVIQDGRTLIPFEDFSKLSEAQKRKHWTMFMEPNAVRKLLTRDFAERIRTDLARIRPKGQKTEKPSADNSSPNTEEKTGEEKANTSGKKSFPNTGGGAEGVAGSGTTSDSVEALAKKINLELFGS